MKTILHICETQRLPLRNFARTCINYSLAEERRLNRRVALKLCILGLLFLNITAFGQNLPDSGFTNKAEAKNLMVNGLKEGKWVEYLDEHGDSTMNIGVATHYKLIIYKNSKPFGILRWYNANGVFFKEISYKNGKKNGIERGYFENGKLNFEIPYIDDKEDGLSITYWPSGKLWYEVPYTNGEKNGVSKFYWGNGKPLRMTSYKDGKLEGSDKVYNYLGKLYREDTYVNGVKVTSGNYDENTTPGAIGQHYSDTLLATFYNRVFEKSFGYDGINCGRRRTNNYLVKTEFDTARLLKRIGFDRITFYKDDASLRGLLLKPWKRNNGRVIYTISHTIYDKDTVDVNMNTITINRITRKNISLGISCGGTLGYIPTARFIFDKKNETWKYISTQELMDEK